MELRVGPKGYIHGWIFVGAHPTVGQQVENPKTGEKGVIGKIDAKGVHVQWFGQSGSNGPTVHGASTTKTHAHFMNESEDAKKAGKPSMGTYWKKKANAHGHDALASSESGPESTTKPAGAAKPATQHIPTSPLKANPYGPGGLAEGSFDEDVASLKSKIQAHKVQAATATQAGHPAVAKLHLDAAHSLEFQLQGLMKLKPAEPSAGAIDAEHSKMLDNMKNAKSPSAKTYWKKKAAEYAAGKKPAPAKDPWVMDEDAQTSPPKQESVKEYLDKKYGPMGLPTEDIKVPAGAIDSYHAGLLEKAKNPDQVVGAYYKDMADKYAKAKLSEAYAAQVAPNAIYKAHYVVESKVPQSTKDWAYAKASEADKHFSAEQLDALHPASEQTAGGRTIIKDYTGTFASTANWLLRGDGAPSPSVEERIKKLDKSFKPLKDSGIAYRHTGTTGVFMGVKPGDVIADSGYSSATIKRSAFKSGGQDSTTLIIHAPKGTQAIWANPVSKFKGDEWELLFPRGQKFLVVSDPDYDPKRVVTTSYGTPRKINNTEIHVVPISDAQLSDVNTKGSHPGANYQHDLRSALRVWRTR